MAKNNTVGMEKLNIIVEETIIEGEINATSSIRIDGTIKGTVSTKGKLVIGPSGAVKGDIMCANAEIEGSVDGKVTVSELLSLRSTAKLVGDIITQQLAIQPGAKFSGSCSMGAIVKDIANDRHSKPQRTKTA